MSTPDPIAAAALGVSLSLESRTPTPRSWEEEVVELYDELREGVLRFLLSLGVLPHEGEEIAQEVFVALFRHLQQGRPRSNLKGWIFQVAHNLGLKRREKAKRESLIVVRLTDAAIQAHVDRALNPEEQLAGTQHKDRLQAVLQALPEQDRCCLALRADGLRYREIAKVLGISLGSVANSIERSLSRLARADRARVVQEAP